MIPVWYRNRLKVNVLGTVLATCHCLALTLLITAITVDPGRDWYWWTVLPWMLDLPVSVVIEQLNDLIVRAAVGLSLPALERALSAADEPFSSFALFWVPAVTYTIIGTAWHYYWPALLKRIVSGPRASAPTGS